MAYVYILSVYDEDGAERVRATLDRDLLADLLSEYDAVIDTHDARSKLAELLAKPDSELVNGEAGFYLDAGAAFHLHVVELAVRK